MQTHTVPLAPRSDSDEILIEKLRPLAMPVDDAAGAIRIGIEGPDGRLYRVIETSSVVEAVHVFETLNELGWVPSARSRRHEPGFTRVFHRHAGHC